MSSASRVLAFVTATIAFAGTSTQAATLLVPSQYATIQSAVDAAAVAGDVILFSPGTYLENHVVASKSLEPRSSGGPDQTTIDGGGHSGSAVAISVYEYAPTLF